MKTLSAFALIALFAVGAGAAERAHDFAYQLPLVVSSPDGLQALELPAQTYSGVVRADLADLRVFNAAGEPVPFAFVPPAAPVVIERPRVAVPFFSVRADPASDLDRIELRIDRNAGGTRINVVSTPGAAAPQTIAYLVDASGLKSAEQPALPVVALVLGGVPAGTVLAVRVDASDDLKDWRTVATGASIVHLASQGAVLQRSRIEIGGSRANYFRLSWPASGARLQIASVSVDQGSASAPAPARSWVERPGKPAERAGEFVFDAGGQFPVDRLRFTLPEANTVGRIEILARAKPELPWRPIATTVVYRLIRDGAEVTSPELPIGAAAERYWLVRADARGGGIGSTPPALHFGWLPQRIAFVARGAPPFTLAFGNHHVSAGALAIETIVPGYRAGVAERLPLARIETAADRAAADAKGAKSQGITPPPAPIDTKKWLLWSSLLAGVALVALLAWRLLREQRPPAQ